MDPERSMKLTALRGRLWAPWTRIRHARKDFERVEINSAPIDWMITPQIDSGGLGIDFGSKILDNGAKDSNLVAPN
jgi:hypothetical protein